MNLAVHVEFPYVLLKIEDMDPNLEVFYELFGILNNEVLHSFTHKTQSKRIHIMHTNHIIFMSFVFRFTVNIHS